MIKPRQLCPGDPVELICPASPPGATSILDQCVEAVRALGFEARLGRNAGRTRGFLAGQDEERYTDLMNAFLDPEVRAIFCVRGGYGSMRLLPYLDYELIRDHPKILVGYSDITALHCALISQSSLACFHGPLCAGELIQTTTPDWTRSTLTEILNHASEGTRCIANKDAFPGLTSYKRGSAEGVLLGGNLTLLAALTGTGYLPSFEGAILFLEEINEAPYRVDRYLTQLILSGVLRGVKGVLIGQFTGCVDSGHHVENPERQTVEQVLIERLSTLDVPIMGGLPFGHVAGNLTLPLGIRARFDTETFQLELLEPAVLPAS